MPAKSAKQLKLMQAVANNPKFAKKVNIPQSVGEEYSKESKMYNKKMMKGGKVKKMMGGGMAMADRTGTRAMDPRMAMAMDARRRQAAMGGMKEGGSIKDNMKAVAKGAAFGNPKTRKKIKEGITGAAKKIKSKLGMKKGGMVSSASKRADGCVTKGRTRGKMV